MKHDHKKEKRINTTLGWRWHAPGAPEQLTLETTEVPALGAHEVLVENQMIAFNPVDWKLMEGGHSAWQPGQIPGVDGMGLISAVGSGITHLKTGARVAYHTDLRRNGSFARHTVVPARALLAVPDALSDAAAASLPCPGLTAWQALAKLPNLSGEALLVAGAASSVGRFAAQLALQQGARVFASASGGHHDWLKQLGVQGVADYHAENWMEQLRAANGGERFKAIIDVVSSRQATELMSHLGYYGHIVAVLGRVEQNPQPAFTHCVSLHEIALGAQHEFGSDRQWRQLVCAGESMLDQMVSGTLATAPLKIGEFAALPALLAEFKAQGQGTKYLVRVA